jgi:hypothetical protein
MFARLFTSSQCQCVSEGESRLSSAARLLAGFFYVEGTFYQRFSGDGAAEDMSAPIRRFCEEHRISAPRPAPSHPLAQQERPLPGGRGAADSPAENPTAAPSLAELTTLRSTSSAAVYPFRKAAIEVRVAEHPISSFVRHECDAVVLSFVHHPM